MVFGFHCLGIWQSGGYQGLPWALWGPLGRQGVPNQGSGSEKLGYLTSLGVPKWIQFGMKFRLDF